MSFTIALIIRVGAMAMIPEVTYLVNSFENKSIGTSTSFGISVVTEKVVLAISNWIFVKSAILFLSATFGKYVTGEQDNGENQKLF
jgi:hypothetical protein